MRAAYDALPEETKAQIDELPVHHSIAYSRRTLGFDFSKGEEDALLRDLIEHAIQREFVYRHCWRAGDLVIWDNRATMHRATPFEDTKVRGELRRVTTLDIAEEALTA
jgi:alpha-ketoglutarate-dependent 2,4-dichlorophenoxyacetate dioxygenase